MDVALFVSAGGYHHHIDVPTVDDVEALQSRLRDHRIGTRHDGQTLSFEDPWNTIIHVKAAGPHHS